MKRSFSFRFFTVFAACSLALAGAQADTIELKSGEKIEGKILSETALDVLIEYNITPKIKDTKTIRKDEIAKLVKLTPSQTAFMDSGLAKLLPSADLLTAANYEEIIQDKLRPFINKFPDTPESKEAERIVAELNDEKEKALAGGVKYEGQWLDAQTAKSDVYNIAAYRHRLEMNRLASVFTETSHLNAIREFEVIQNQYPASSQYVAAIPEVLEHIDKYEKYLAALLREAPVLAKQNAASLKALPPNEARVVQAKLDEEAADLKARIAADTKAGFRLLPINKLDEKSIASAIKGLETIRREIQALDLEVLKRENTTYTSIQRAIALNKDGDADRLFKAIDANKVVNRKTYEAVRKQIQTLVAELKKQGAKTGLTSGMRYDSNGAAIEGSSEGENPLAEQVKKAEEEKAKKAKEAAEKKAAEAKKAEEEAAARRAAEAAAQEETLLQKLEPYLPYVGGGLVVVLLLTFVLGKKKKNED